MVCQTAKKRECRLAHRKEYFEKVLRDARVLDNRMNGVRRNDNLVGQNGKRWSGGCWVTCCICGDECGYKNPGLIRKRNNLFYCRKHLFQYRQGKGENNHNWKEKVECRCFICDKFLGMRIPSYMKKRDGVIVCHHHTRLRYWFMKMKSANNFNDHWVGFEEDRIMLAKNAGNAIRNMQNAKAASYRMAVHYVAMHDTHRAALIQEIKSKYPHEKSPVDKWIEDCFAPLLAIGGDPVHLIRGIKDGLTIKQYLVAPHAMLLNFQKKTKYVNGATSTSTAIPAEPPVTLTKEEQIKALKNRCTAMELELKRLRPFEGRCAILEKQLRRLQSIVEKVNV